MLLVAGVSALQAAALASQQPQALRTLGSFQGDSVRELSTAPNGRFVQIATETGLWMYDVASRQSWTLVQDPAWSVSWSPGGDRIAYVRDGDHGSENEVWMLPVDANTGRARGPAQRITIRSGECPTFSVDGRWIAFAGVDSAGTADLSVVPATGGPDRVLARGAGLCGGIWSADGKTIFVAAWGGAHRGSILRIRVADGATEVLRSRDELLAGVTADRRFLVLVPAKARVLPGDQATVIDTAGREVGHAPLPVGELVEYDGVLGDSALVWTTFRNRTVIELRSMDGGNPRRLPLIGESDDFPIWSPDGHWIAFQVREGSLTSLAAMNANGANPQVYRQSDISTQIASAKWSPDSRLVAFVSADRYRMSVLDVAAGTIRTVFEDTARYIGGNWRWRSDGRAIDFRARSYHSPASTIDEVTLDGHHRQLRDWSGSANWQFVGDSSLFVRTDSAAMLWPLPSGSARRLASAPPPGTGNGLEWPVVSNDGRWIGGPWSGGGLPHQVELFSLETGARTVLDVPFNIVTFNSPPAFVPDNSALLLFGFGRPGGPGATLYRVPLNGAEPRAIVNVGRNRPGAGLNASASPDGRTVAYSVQPEGPTRSLVLIDLRGAIPRAPSRPPRR